jgi:hypothetical protein
LTRRSRLGRLDGNLVRQPALADSWLARQQEKTAAAAASFFQSGAQLGQFTLSADEGTLLRIE